MITRQCVILVGGEGTRLGSLTKRWPKPLLPVDGTPFLETLLLEARRRGFDDLVLLAGYRAEEVSRYLEQSQIAAKLGVLVRVSFEASPMGTAGALAHAAPLLAESFLLLNGDTWFDFNWLDFVCRAENTDRAAAMAVRQIECPDRYETITVVDDRVVAVRQREIGSDFGLINGGVYWFRKDTIRSLSIPASLETQLLPLLSSRGELGGYRYEGFFLDIGIPETYEAAQHLVPRQRRRPAVFLDRGGVLNEDAGYNYKTEDLRWISGAKAAIKLLNDAGFYVFVVTNQSGIGHGYFTSRDFESLKQSMENELREAAAAIDDWRYCPYHPEAALEQFRKSHSWRKPRPGMLLDILEHWPVNVERSFLVGDKSSEIEAARGAGIVGYRFRGGDLAGFVKQQIRARTLGPDVN